MPRSAEPAVRAALIESAAAMLAAREPVTSRALAQHAGTSTMGVYTHFGGMAGLWAAVRAEGFRRLSERLATVVASADAVRDLGALSAAYARAALLHPALYRAMFDAAADLSEPEIADGTFDLLVATVRRAHDDGRLDGATAPTDLATQLWAAGHGLLTLVLAGVLPVSAIAAQSPPTVVALLTLAGDVEDRCRSSVDAGWSSAWLDADGTTSC